jgi:DNA-binding Lrp family transcriptional regulator
MSACAIGTLGVNGVMACDPGGSTKRYARATSHWAPRTPQPNPGAPTRDHRIPLGSLPAANTDGVAEVYTTTGSADFIAIVRVADLETLATVVTERIASFEGINSTDTHLAIRSWSASDEGAAFDIGID